MARGTRLWPAPVRNGPTRRGGLPDPGTPFHPPRHTDAMDDEVVYMVHGATRAVCQRELDRLCAALGARPTTRPTGGTGRGWTARAVLIQKAPTAESGRGQGEAG